MKRKKAQDTFHIVCSLSIHQYYIFCVLVGYTVIFVRYSKNQLNIRTMKLRNKDMKADVKYCLCRFLCDLFERNHCRWRNTPTVHDWKRNAASVYVHAFEIFAFYLIPGNRTRVLKFRFFSSRVYLEDWNWKRDRGIRGRASVYSSRNSCAWTGIRLRDFEIRLKGNIPRFSGRISPRKRSLAFSSHALCYRPCQKYGIKDRGVNQSDGTNIESLREGETVIGVGGWRYESRDREERAVRKICQDLRARNSPHGCPECKEFFVPLSLVLDAAAAAMSVKTVPGRRLRVHVCRAHLSPARVTVNYSLTINPRRAIANFVSDCMYRLPVYRLQRGRILLLIPRYSSILK